jgi:hypothetical protein
MAAPDEPIKRCLSYATGHTPHWIQSFHSMYEGETPPEEAALIEAKSDGTIIVDVDGKRRAFWNHQPARLARLAARNEGRVTVQERWSLLRTPSPDGMYCFSILIPDSDTLPLVTMPATCEPPGWMNPSAKQFGPI